MNELLRSLPNGLHDAELTAIAVDYARAEVTASVVVDLSDPDDPSSEGRARNARLVFTGVSCLVVDSPEMDPGDQTQAQLTVIRIDAETGQPETSPRPDLQAPDSGFLCWIYLSSLNGFIRIGARDVRLEWTEPGPPYRRSPA
jgi:hypothetical protein